MAFRLNSEHDHFWAPQLAYPDGILHHVISEGARFHTPHWDSAGQHCSEKNCEVNHGGIRNYVGCPGDK